jgi:hypothetical protein
MKVHDMIVQTADMQGRVESHHHSNFNHYDFLIELFVMNIDEYGYVRAVEKLTRAHCQASTRLEQKCKDLAFFGVFL